MASSPLRTSYISSLPTLPQDSRDPGWLWNQLESVARGAPLQGGLGSETSEVGLRLLQQTWPSVAQALSEPCPCCVTTLCVHALPPQPRQDFPGWGSGTGPHT